MPSVRKHPGGSVQGRTQRAQAASMRPSISARDGEGEGDREADIAEIEQRRMDGEAGILQERVEVLPLERRRAQPRERVGGEQHEEQERRRDQRPARASTLARRRSGQVAPRQRDQRAEQRRGSAPRAASSLRGCPRRR